MESFISDQIVEKMEYEVTLMQLGAFYHATRATTHTLKTP